MKARKKRACGRFWALRQVFKSKMRLSSKIKILESCILPAMTYGAQTWASTKSLGRSLQVTQRYRAEYAGDKKKRKKKKVGILFGPASASVALP